MNTKRNLADNQGETNWVAKVIEIESSSSPEAEILRQAEAAGVDLEKTLAEAKAKAQGLGQEAHQKLAGETEAKRKTLEGELNAKLAAAEAQIADTKAKAMSNVETVAKDTAAAIVEHLTGKPADPQKIAAALANAKA